VHGLVGHISEDDPVGIHASVVSFLSDHGLAIWRETQQPQYAVRHALQDIAPENIICDLGRNTINDNNNDNNNNDNNNSYNLEAFQLIVLARYLRLGRNIMGKLQESFFFASFLLFIYKTHAGDAQHCVQPNDIFNHPCSKHMTLPYRQTFAHVCAGAMAQRQTEMYSS